MTGPRPMRIHFYLVFKGTDLNGLITSYIQVIRAYGERVNIYLLSIIRAYGKRVNIYLLSILNHLDKKGSSKT